MSGPSTLIPHAIPRSSYGRGDIIVLAYGHGSQAAKVLAETPKRLHIVRLEARNTQAEAWGGNVSTISREDKRILGELDPRIARQLPPAPTLTTLIQELQSLSLRKMEHAIGQEAKKAQYQASPDNAPVSQWQSYDTLLRNCDRMAARLRQEAASLQKRVNQLQKLI